ncbi:Hypothetical protein PHPALM_6932 [Phytophthora palmivora]|uniref:FYVE-type domain-containing protein n=1 Tax=Phytophthora palmivora TaxID=4796 RepID=A0A2P4YDL6_9STRA|nr:Hypothetical protein PHPALM_6932 [Phytophthora palmivora]
MPNRSRLRLDTNSKNTTTSSSAKTKSALSSAIDEGPLVPPLPLLITLRDLLAEAEASHDQVDFATFINIAESPHLQHGQAQWKCIERSPTFTLLKHEDEVLAQACLDATAEEVVSALGATTDELHVATMKGLYGDAFIAGSVPFVHRPQTYEDNPVYHQLEVKTSSFVHSGFFGKNEQWCYAEMLRSNPESGNFKLTQGSLPDHEAQSLPARAALKNNKRVAQLGNVTAAFMIDRVSDGHNLRITFHALCNPNVNGSDDGSPVVSKKAARARLICLARGISEISQFVRRRRFGAQVFADRSAFDVRNSRCTCCTRRLTIFIARTRCYLCGYYVCSTCSSSEKMETHNGRLASIIVCTRCVRSVTACDYEHMLTVRPGPERVLSDPSLSSIKSFTTTSELSSFPEDSQSSSSQKLGELLTQIVDDDSTEVTPGRHRAAFMVLEQLLLIEQQESQAQADRNAKLLLAIMERPDPVETAKRVLDVSAYPKDPAACKFASADLRPYPMIPALVDLKDSSGGSGGERIVYPIPANEDERMAAIEHFSLHDIINVSELNVICTLAAAEMGCPHSVITLVERDVVTLLATNAPDYWDIGSSNPREQTFCQHFVMDDQPLLVRHAESDMSSAQFTFLRWFPVSVTSILRPGRSGESDKVVVGALCCLDEKPHEMTRLQYWRLMKLATAASKILESKAMEYISTNQTFV